MGAMVMRDELKAMKAVLRKLGYTNPTGVVETKGRVACEINAGDEIVLTELIFGGVFGELTVPQAVGLLTCFVFQEKGGENQKLPEDLQAPLRTLQETARRVATVAQECRFPIQPEDYVQSFKTGMMEVGYAWAKGAKFLEICQMTDIFEGSLIRAFRRLEELARQLGTAAKAIGSSDLEEK